MRITLVDHGGLTQVTKEACSDAGSMITRSATVAIGRMTHTDMKSGKAVDALDRVMTRSSSIMYTIR
jgi:hypothetical protein